MKHYPILYVFRDKVLGDGFLADVTTHGRALAVQEDEGWWIHGVEPGDIAASGATFPEVQAEFRKMFTAVLFDIAEDTKDQKSFKAEVEHFFKATNRPTAEEWEAALVEVRAGRVTAEAIADGLSMKPADSPRFVEVRIINSPKAKDNVLDHQMAIAA